MQDTCVYKIQFKMDLGKKMFYIYFCIGTLGCDRTYLISRLLALRVLALSKPALVFAA